MSEPLAETLLPHRSLKRTKQQGRSPLIVKDGVEVIAADETLLSKTKSEELLPVQRFIARFENDPVWDTIADAIKSCSEDVEQQKQVRDK